MQESRGCVEADAILAFLDGKMPDVVRNEFDGHLDRCAECQAVVLGAGANSAPRDRSVEFGTRVVPLPIFPPDTVVAGRYRIGHLLGRGGMGEVYAADDMQLGTRVALKTVNGLIAASDHIGLRLKREVLLARRVTHPSVCRVFDFGVHETVAFLTMELLAGETLGSRLRRAGPMSPDEALPIVAQLVGALEAAHASGVIHRDFKSDNVILVQAENGNVRAVVTDFGLAHAHCPGVDAANRAQDSSSGRFVGTLSYMAPEQIAGGNVTPLADVYAVGVVIFEMITGGLPFSDSSPMRRAVRRLTERPISPRVLVPSLPAAWEAVVMRCLERDPRKRFANVSAVLAALRRQPPAGVARVGMSRLSVAFLILLVASAVAVPIGWAAARWSPPSLAAGSSPPPPAPGAGTPGPQPNEPALLTPQPEASEAPSHRRRRGQSRHITPPVRATLTDGAPTSDVTAPPRSAEADELLDPRDGDLIDPYRARATE